MAHHASDQPNGNIVIFPVDRINAAGHADDASGPNLLKVENENDVATRCARAGSFSTSGMVSVRVRVGLRLGLGLGLG